MKILEYIESKKNEFFAKRKNSEYLIRQMLKSSHPEKIVGNIDFDTCTLPLEVLKMKVEGYYNLFDYILKEVCGYARFSASDINNPDIIIPLVLNKKNLRDLHLCNQSYLIKMPNGESVLEYIFSNCDDFVFDSKLEEIEIARILYKNGKIDSLKLCTPGLYKEELEPGVTIGDVIKKNKIIPADVRMVLDSDFLSSYTKSYMLLDKVDEEKTLLEFLLDNNIEFKLSLLLPNKDLPEIARILYQRDRFDIINTITESVLLTEVTKNWDLLALCNKKKVYPRVAFNMSDKRVILTYLMAKQIDEIVSAITKDALCIKVNETDSILDFLINTAKTEKKDIKDLIVTLLSNGLIGKEAALILAKHGYYVKPNDYEMVSGINKENKLINDIYGMGGQNLNSKYQMLVEEFYEAFSDGLSSQNLLDLVIKSFNKHCTIDEKCAVRDLRILIEYKRKVKNFRFIYNPNDSSCFSNDYISLSSKNNIDSLNHELGHLIHQYINNRSTPSNFNGLLDGNKGLSTEEKTEIFKEINREATELFTDESKYTNLFLEYITKSYGGIEEYKAIIREDFITSLGTEQLLLDCLKGGKYSVRVLNEISNECFHFQASDDDEKNKILEEYVKERLKLEFELFKETMYWKENYNFLCYENFIDAYLGGALGDAASFYTAMFKSKNIDVKAPLCTHDSFYFIQVDPFNELFANYVELLNADNGPFYIEKLKEKTSKELIGELDNFYRSISLEREKNTRSSKKY